MDPDNNNASPVFSANVVEFVTVANEFCVQVENCAKAQRGVFMDRMSKILPLLYLKAALLPEVVCPIDDELQAFVSLDLYNSLRSALSELFGPFDDYLDTQVSDMKYSDQALSASISENLADVYQSLRDTIANFQTANSSVMLQAVASCREDFRNLWGRKCLSSLLALHNALYSEEASLNDDDFFDTDR